MNTNKLTQLALLATVALTIFLVELHIPNPIPVPGVKLGLANIVTVYAIYYYRGREVLLLVMTRILLGSIFGGNLMALLYSMAGGLLCLAGMLVLRRFVPVRAIWISSVLGAMLHNIGQLTVATAVMGPAVLAYLPFLTISGCGAGMFTGLCAQYLIQHQTLTAKISQHTTKMIGGTKT